jgi:hypothetical protein
VMSSGSPVWVRCATLNLSNSSRLTSQEMTSSAVRGLRPLMNRKSEKERCVNGGTLALSSGNPKGDRMSSLIQRIRTHLIDERINSVAEADAEMQLMTHSELIEVISFVLDDILAGRPTYAPGEFAGDRRRARRAARKARSRRASRGGLVGSVASPEVQGRPGGVGG